MIQTSSEAGKYRSLSKGLEREEKKKIHGVMTAQKISLGQLFCRFEFSQKKVEKNDNFFLNQINSLINYFATEHIEEWYMLSVQ